ncbi:MAG: hypothetical protein K6G55_06335 [Selenomonadaceae bacterium]|nr:hypothetical protein [Selenomonadaceae bacterium]
MRKFLISVITFAAIVTTFATVLSAAYVGNSNTGKFHYYDCYFAGKMNPNNRISFSTRDEAINRGYTPCKRCKP